MNKPWCHNELSENMTESQREVIKIIVNILKDDEFFGKYEDMIKVIKSNLLTQERMLEIERKTNNEYEGEYGSQI